jgi:hypothetical protein
MNSESQSQFTHRLGQKLMVIDFNKSNTKYRWNVPSAHMNYLRATALGLGRYPTPVFLPLLPSNNRSSGCYNDIQLLLSLFAPGVFIVGRACQA